MLIHEHGADLSDPSRNGDGVGVGRIIVGYNDGVTVLTLVGEHDASTAGQLLVTIRDHADLGRGVAIVLSETRFLDSSIVRQLFRGDMEMLHKGRRLVILSDPDSAVERILELAGVRAQLLCADTLDEAARLATQCYRE